MDKLAKNKTNLNSYQAHRAWNGLLFVMINAIVVFIAFIILYGVSLYGIET